MSSTMPMAAVSGILEIELFLVKNVTDVYVDVYPE